MHIVFPGPTSVRCFDLIDVDLPAPEENVTVVLTDASGNQRVYFVPANWTGDVSTDGPPGFGTLNVITSNPQPGFGSVATLVSSDAGYDNEAVVAIEIILSSSAGVDNIVTCD